MLSPITQNTLFYGAHRPILREYLAHLLHGATVQMPPQYGTFCQAPRVAAAEAEQGRLELE
jgi:hypothetical protein